MSFWQDVISRFLLGIDDHSKCMIVCLQKQTLLFDGARLHSRWTRPIAEISICEQYWEPSCVAAHQKRFSSWMSLYSRISLQNQLAQKLKLHLQRSIRDSKWRRQLHPVECCAAMLRRTLSGRELVWLIDANSAGGSWNAWHRRRVFTIYRCPRNHMFRRGIKTIFMKERWCVKGRLAVSPTWTKRPGVDPSELQSMMFGQHHGTWSLPWRQGELIIIAGRQLQRQHVGEPGLFALTSRSGR